MSTKQQREVSLKQACIGFFLPITFVIGLVIYGADILGALTIGILASASYASFLGFQWTDIQGAATKGAQRVLPAAIIMMLVGALIGIWMVSGSVPSMLYFGIKLIHPAFFLTIAFLICVITSLATGTSWGTAGTMGVALIGIASGVGISLPATAGAIISGALIGDKFSPLSDTTLLASASAGADLFDHITSMLYTTVPAALVCIVAYTGIGLQYRNLTLESESIIALQNGLHDNFQIGLLPIIPVALILILSAKKVPAIIVFSVGILFSGLWAMITQGANLLTVFEIAINGYDSRTGVESIDSLLSKGGAMSMAHTIYVSLGAGIFGGILNETGILQVLIHKIAQSIKSAGTLIATVTASCLGLMIGGGGQYCTLSLPGVAFAQAFKEKDIHPSVLSRTMEDSGTLVGSVIPWDVSALFYASILGVATLDYLSFTYLVILSPILAIANGYLGFGVFRANENVRLFYRRSAS